MSRSIFDPLVPAGAYDAFVADGAARSAGQRAWQPADGALPALYIGHGAPPLLDDAQWMSQLAAWTLTMPKPRAVLIVSAHWEAAPLMLSAPGAGHAAGVRLRRVRRAVLHADVPDAGRHRVRGRGRGADAGYRRPRTSTRAGGSTTGRGCR